MPRTFYKRLFDISEKRILIFMVLYFLLQTPVAPILSFCFEFHICNYWVFIICVLLQIQNCSLIGLDPEPPDGLDLIIYIRN